ncbi:ATP-binding protein [Planctobacterium marinum]|uniref:ATP-binding protein n=1 Tax=Planctobacterium marinum TaxID=1631968 RepID=UPI001E454E93|nr:ATP-binding protein [Planctobacterium marinum]MCC2607967.1 helix-turn-helix domain-containing protein [Planctobacterium marinum]
MITSPLTPLFTKRIFVCALFAALFFVHFLLLLTNVAHQLNWHYAVLLQGAHVLYSLIILIFISVIPKEELDLKEKLFWFCFSFAMFLWLLTKISLLILMSARLSDWIYLLADYGYFAFFLVACFAQVFFSNQDHPGVNKHPQHGTLTQIVSLCLMGGLFVYLVVIPSQSAHTEFNQHYSSFLFYILMDLYLFTLYAISAKSASEALWRQRFTWISLSFGLLLLLDLTELSIKAGILPMQIEGTFSLLWYLPYVALAFAFQPNTHIYTLVKSPKTLPTWLPDHTLVGLVLLPIVHAAGYGSGVFAEDLKPLREYILVCWVVIFAAFIYLRQWFTQNQKQDITPELFNKSTGIEKPNITQNLPFPSFVLDKLGKIEFCNRAAAEKFNYSESALIGTFFSGLLAKDEPLETMLRFSESAFTESKLVTQGMREAFFRDQQGKQLTCYVAFAELEEGGYVASLVDVSRLHEAEQQALSIKDKFLANITHEFRTPLTIIQGALDEGIEHCTDDTLTTRLNAARTNAIRILKMVEQLLNLSKITSAPKLDKVAQPASQIINDTCQQFAQLCQNKNISFSYKVTPGAWINVHDDALQQILYNLLSNAYKYSVHDSQIEVSAQVQSDVLFLTISDTGCGMTEEEQARLFERFQRADSARRSDTFGVGIGLSLVSELVTLHDWHIAVDSTLNEGTTFTIKIPCSSPEQSSAEQVKVIDFNVEEADVEKVTGRRAPKDATQAHAPDNKLLIIEDNPDMQEYLRHLMADLYQTDIITNGKPGIEQAIIDIPDVIICDLMLPDISGFEVVKQLKAHPVTQHIPILMLTAKSDTQSKLQGLEHQADDYLTKPFHHKELQLRVGNLLQNRARQQQQLREQLQHETLNRAKSHVLPSEVPAQEVLPHQQFLDKLQGISEKYYQDESFAPSQLASELALSERQLQRKLKAALNMTPGEYLREYRLLKSRELLAQGMPIGRVAEEVGFANQNYFTRCFKQQCGQTPSEYQKSVNPEREA